ncbi:hypothetical protein [Kitasatospora sp. NPDC093102]|uniref:hypothetical protein n=1 Tax=Kitasatospora sp. NPDC093102 TaxID=3155069 RepID=UPI0034362DD9
MLSWLQHSPNARLLGKLAAEGAQLSHDLLDQLPPSRHELQVRNILVHSGVLPERHEDLDRIPAWLDQLLTGRTPQHARLIRPFVHWSVLKRARRRAIRRQEPSMAGYHLRTRIRVALEFLTWLDEQKLSLGDLTQHDLDRWLADGNTRHYTIRYFLGWAAARGLAHDVTVPAIAWGGPADILNEDDRWDQLKRCLNEISMPLDVRVAGAMMLLFGLPMSRVLHLRAEHMHQQDGDTYLDIGKPALIVPPKLAVLLHQLVETPVRQAFVAGNNSGPGWLFPGLLPSRPVTPSYFNHKLTSQGINVRPARNGALVALAADIPSPVLADLLGLHITTVVRWAGIARRDWTDYLVARAADDEEAR